MPTVGTEGVIATVDDYSELIKKLKEAKDRERAMILEKG